MARAVKAGRRERARHACLKEDMAVRRYGVPAGSETVVENVKSAFAAAQSAYQNVVSINKQIYDTVEKSVEQNVANVKSATNKAKRSTKR